MAENSMKDMPEASECHGDSPTDMTPRWGESLCFESIRGTLLDSDEHATASQESSQTPPVPQVGSSLAAHQSTEEPESTRLQSTNAPVHPPENQQCNQTMEDSPESGQSINTNTSDMAQEITPSTSSRLFKCNYNCPQSKFKTQTKLKNHMAEQHDSFQCSDCSEEFKKQSDLRKHYHKIHFKWYCIMCRSLFDLEAEWKAHESEKHFTVELDENGKKIYVCLQCRKERTTNLGALINHIIKIHNNKALVRSTK